ncbi:MAG: hypothetical protein NTV49_13570 [Kiritimatiellaeota bacterium]|nr:hypothetical protein [Kiritimatiellota bacterium]
MKPTPEQLDLELRRSAVAQRAAAGELTDAEAIRQLDQLGLEPILARERILFARGGSDCIEPQDKRKSIQP